MLDLSEITARVTDAPRPTSDVEVVFDAGLAGELEALRATRSDLLTRLEEIETSLEEELELLQKDLRAGDGRPAAAREQAETQKQPVEAEIADVDGQIEAVEERAADFVVTFRFTALLKSEWAELCARSVPRPDHPEDADRDYNMDEVTRIAATRSGVRVADDGTTVPVTSTEWDSVWAVLHRFELRNIKLTIFTLNEYAGMYAHSEAVAAARKVSAARQAATQTSPSTSASTRDASTGGNPSPSRTTSTTTKAA